MDNVLSYHVYQNGLWLDESEQLWTRHFHEAAAFTAYELADDIAKRECGDSTFYVFACMASR